MGESRKLNIGYPPFKLAFEVEAYANVDTLSVCGWCSALVVDTDRHTAMHSCGCSGMFRAEHATAGIHEIDVCPLAQIAQTDSAEWPPLVDDLWSDRHGVKWFAMENRGGDVLLTDRSGGRHGPEYVNSQYGPMTLVHREAATSDG